MSLFNLENSIKNRIAKHRYIYLFFFFSVFTLLLRISMYKATSDDYRIFLNPWFQTIKQMHGLHALRVQVGDYGIAYQFIIALLTYLPFNNLYLYKAVSIIFDYILAISSGFLACTLSSKKSDNIAVFTYTYGLVLLLPTIVLDSSFWAQCDSIYSSFIVLSLCFLIKKDYLWSFIFLGISFAFKFQTVFLLPFFIFVWLTNKHIYLFHFLISIVVFWMSGIPAYLHGRSILTPFTIYLNQTHTYKSLFMNCYNFAGMFGFKINDSNFYDILSKSFIFLTFSVLMLGLFWYLDHYYYNPLNMIYIATWTIYTCIMFLPSMHERYSFIIDVILIVLSMSNKKVLPVAILEISISLIAYSHFLFFYQLSNPYFNISISYLSFFVYLYFTVLSCCQFKDRINMN